MQNINHSNLPLKTLELLLLRYTEMHTAILKDSAEKRKFKTLMEEVSNQIDILSDNISELHVHDYANLGLVVKYRNGSNTL